MLKEKQKKRLRFGLIGVGYVAPKHLDAIHHIGGELVWACDVHDAVGVLDRWVPRCAFNPADDRSGDIDCAIVAVPNNEHVPVASLFLELGKHVIVEKPLGLTVDGIKQALGSHAPRVHPVVQLRDHPAVLAYPAADRRKARRCDIRYTVWRGDWYSKSWKGDEARSGGIMSNIGVHLFDLAIHLFGRVVDLGLERYEPDNVMGWLRHEQGTETRWHLSTRSETDRRLFIVDDGEWRLDLTNAADLHLHRKTYERMVLGSSWGIDDVCRAIAVIQDLRIKAKEMSA